MRALFNQYLPEEGFYQCIPEVEDAPQEDKKRGIFDFFSSFSTGEKKNAGGLSSILKRFHLEDLDSGDILLLLILVLILLEGDNWEMAILLGLVLFFGLRGDDTVEDAPVG